MRGWYDPLPRLQRYDIYDDAPHIKGLFRKFLGADVSFVGKA